VVDAANVAGLTISVVTADVQPAASESEFPVWSTTRVLEGATRGKPGGLR
jgi:hypothetical protein